MKICTTCKRELGFNESWYELKKKVLCEDCLFKQTYEDAESKLSDIS